MSTRGHTALMERWGCAVLLLVAISTASAQQQFDGMCARIKVSISQQLALERVGFEATLEITNNDPTDPIADFGAQLTFENPKNSTSNHVDDASNLFFVRQPELEGIAGVNGDGIILPGQTAVIRWFIIPKPSAGGENVKGIRYRVGCDLSATLRGEAIPEDELFAVPDSIDVKPEPLLDITYFQPRDVQGDDPFTEAVESPVPFALGILVRNVGHGIARDLHVHSEQPRIVENRQQLLIVARLLGARVNDHPLNYRSLTVNIGDIMPGRARKAAWDMTTSLSGEFLEFKASYTHAPEFGGEETSIITNLSAHFLVHEVLSDLAGRDGIKDFLADVDRDGDLIADTLYETDGNVYPVNHLAGASAGVWNSPGDPLVVEAPSAYSGWVYLRVDDPAETALPIDNVVRDDGKVINTNNVWTSYRYDTDNNKRSYLHIFDIVEPGSNSYTVNYVVDPADTNPPVSTIEFAGDVEWVNGRYHIDPDTEIFFLAQDQNPVSQFYRIDDGPLAPAFPFHFASNGVYVVDFLGEDSYGNREATQTVSVVVSSDPPATGVFALSDDAYRLSGDAMTLHADSTRIRFQVASNALPVTAVLDIYRGLVDVATISNAPASLESVRTVVYEDVGTNEVAFEWDGTDNEGDLVVPGWHTVSVALRDTLSHTSWVVQAVHVDALEPGIQTLAGPTNGPGRPQGRGRWVVWHDQRDGNDEVYARDMLGGGATYKMTSGLRNQRNARTDGRYAVWQGRQQDGNWDLYWAELPSTGTVQQLTFSSGHDEVSSDIDWPWVVYQSKGMATPSAPWQVKALNLTSGVAVAVSPSSFDQVDPRTRDGMVVWQDWRNVGSGEIYLSDLEGSNQWRITTSVYGQYAPVIDGEWIVWQDNRHGQNELYGFNLLKGSEQRLTDSAENESQPVLEGEWLVCIEDSLEPPFSNLRLIHLPGLEAIPLTRSETEKSRPTLAGRHTVWLDKQQGVASVLGASLPGVQALFKTQNAIPVTELMVSNYTNAFALLETWQSQAGVTQLVHFAQLTPTIVKQQATWSNGAAQGDNFPLVAGDFLWVRFSGTRVVDLGLSVNTSLDLAAGISAVSCTRFPQPLTAHGVIRQLGLDTVESIRMLDSRSGRWMTAEVRDGVLVGHNFSIPRSAVLLMDLKQSVNSWSPE